MNKGAKSFEFSVSVLIKWPAGQTSEVRRHDGIIESDTVPECRGNDGKEEWRGVDPAGRHHEGLLTDEVETHALSGIHLEIHKGEYVSIAGPSGCGKSTLLSILGLLDTPTEGTYLLNGQPVANLTVARARAHPQPRDRVHLPELST